MVTAIKVSVKFLILHLSGLLPVLMAVIFAVKITPTEVETFFSYIIRISFEAAIGAAVGYIVQKVLKNLIDDEER